MALTPVLFSCFLTIFRCVMAFIFITFDFTSITLLTKLLRLLSVSTFVFRVWVWVREEVSGGSIWYRFNKITSEDLPLILVLAAKERNQMKNQQCACADR